MSAETIGAHNADLATSTLRIIKGASWKKANTVCIMPGGGTVATKVALSWLGLQTMPNAPFPRIGVIGEEVGEAYSNAIAGILEDKSLRDFHYILTLEHDNIPPPDGFWRLLEHMDAHPEFACIGGLYWTKGEGGVPQIWGDPKDPVLNFRPQPPDPNGGLVECCGTGMGFNLWRLSMFKDARLRRPWFKTVRSLHEGVGTQDLHFWSDARKYGYRCAVACDVLVGHHDAEADFTW